MVRRRKKGEDEQEGEVFEFPDMHFEGLALDTEPPPYDLPYDEYDDHNAMALLAANGIPEDEEGIIEALAAQTGVLLAAAAHAAGSVGIPAAVPRLRELASGQDDQAAVEAAFALVRLGVDEGRDVLHEALGRSVDAYLSPMLAASYLARLGDPAGYPVVAAALGSEFVSSRMLACKALLQLVPFHGQTDASGKPIDVAALYARALSDPDEGVQGEALVQLRWAPPSLARPLLERYLASDPDELLRGYAQDALDHPAGG